MIEFTYSLGKEGLQHPSFLFRAQKTLLIGVLIFFFLFTQFSFASFTIQFSQEFLDKIKKEYGDYAERRLKAWQKLVDNDQSKNEMEKLTAVNNFFNLMIYQSDISLWGVEDYWASPLEFVVAGAGDCEDYVIAKYFTLRALGVPDSKLMITYVKSLTYNQAHMVLTYYETPKSVPLVLDNYNGEILPATKRNDLVPIYSFNGEGLWAAKQRGLGEKIGGSGDLAQWGDMQTRMEKGIIGKFRQLQ